MVFGANKNISILKFFFKPNYTYAYLKKKKIERKYHNVNLIIGLQSTITNSEIGKHVYIGNNVEVYASSLGNHSYINSKSRLLNVNVGKFCSIASNVIFNLGIHPTNYISTHPAFYANNKNFKTFADKIYLKEENPLIKVGNDVWIGERALIMGGIKIENGAIIAAGAVVTKDVPAFSIVGGVPAKIIRYRFSSDTIDKIQNLKWWDNNEDWLEKNYLLFLDVKKFLQYFNSNEFNTEK